MQQLKDENPEIITLLHKFNKVIWTLRVSQFNLIQFNYLEIGY